MRDWQDDGAPDIVTLSQSTHKARRPHICDCNLRGCRGGIEVGERYERLVFLEDGRFSILRFGRGCGGSIHNVGGSDA